MAIASPFVNRASSCYPISGVPPRFGNVLARIQSVLGSQVLIHSFDGEWLNFTVLGWLDSRALQTMNENVNRILPGHDLQSFQILCPWEPSDLGGLWLHDLLDPRRKADYQSGCWFY